MFEQVAMEQFNSICGQRQAWETGMTKMGHDSIPSDVNYKDWITCTLKKAELIYFLRDKFPTVLFFLQNAQNAFQDNKGQENFKAGFDQFTKQKKLLTVSDLREHLATISNDIDNSLTTGSISKQNEETISRMLTKYALDDYQAVCNGRMILETN